MSNRVVIVSDAEGFFVQALASAAKNQGVEAAGETIAYLAGMLETLMHPADEMTVDWPRPLAERYRLALHADSPSLRRHALKSLGDEALIISGLFARSLDRKPVDIDYYVAMGVHAYGAISDSLHARHLADGVFDALASRFVDFMGLLAEIGEARQLRDDFNALRLYELWLKTGCRYYARVLANMGVTLNAMSAPS